jgi:hypothetical protein
LEIEEAFTAYLISQIPTLKLYPEEIPQGTDPPAVSYINISDVLDHTLTEQSKLESPVFQFTVLALTKESARTVRNQIEAALKDFAGTMGGIKIQHIKLLNRLSGIKKSPDGTVKVYTEDLEFQISFERS